MNLRDLLIGAAAAGGIVVGVNSIPSGANCPDGWVRTTGIDPNSNVALVSCTDGRYIMTIRDGETVVFDTQEGKFVP